MKIYFYQRACTSHPISKQFEHILHQSRHFKNKETQGKEVKSVAQMTKLNLQLTKVNS